MTKLLAYLFTLVIILKSLGGDFYLLNEYVSGIYIITMVLSLVYCSATSKPIIKSIDNTYMMLSLYLLSNIIITNPPSEFESFNRYGFFLIVLLLVSPFIKNNKLELLRFHLFEKLFISLVVVSIICFFCYFFGINWMMWYGESLSDYEEIGGHFSGILSHSMLLGPYAGMSILYCLYKLFSTNNKLWIIPLLLCAGSLLFAASRAAVIATIIGVAIFLIFRTRNIIRLIKTIAIPILFVALLYPVWDQALSGLEYKSSERIDTANEGGRFGSRTMMFEKRFSEFSSSPFWGVGFASSSDVKELKSNGHIEPGSSWLFVLSSTGIIGIMFLISLFVKSFRMQIRRQSNYSLLIVSLLSFFAVHMLFEGYVFSGGSQLCLMFWLTMGCACDRSAHVFETV